MNVSSRSTNSIYYYSYTRSTTPNGGFQSWRLQSDNSIRHKDFNPSQPMARVPYLQPLRAVTAAALSEVNVHCPKLLLTPLRWSDVPFVLLIAFDSIHLQLNPFAYKSSMCEPDWDTSARRWQPSF